MNSLVVKIDIDVMIHVQLLKLGRKYNDVLIVLVITEIALQLKQYFGKQRISQFSNTDFLRIRI